MIHWYSISKKKKNAFSGHIYAYHASSILFSLREKKPTWKTETCTPFSANPLQIRRKWHTYYFLRLTSLRLRHCIRLWIMSETYNVVFFFSEYHTTNWSVFFSYIIIYYSCCRWQINILRCEFSENAVGV